MRRILDDVLTKEFLQEEYINKEKSALKIANEIDCSKWTILHRLKEYNISTRKKENCRKIIKCDMCGKELWKYEYDLKKYKHFFCSNKCYLKHRSLYNPAKRKDVQEKMSISAKKRKNESNYIDGRSLKDYFCKVCCKKIDKITGLYGKQHCLNCHLSLFNYVSRIKYNNTIFKSSWEANFAKWCDLSGIKWEYEPRPFILILNNKKTRYFPDFYLPEFDIWIEIKGRWQGKAKQKIKKFRKTYCNYKLEIFDFNKLKQLGVI